MAVNGHIGSAGGRISLASPVSLGVSAPSGQYPNGTITFSDIKAGGCYWRNNNDAPLSMDVYLCDSAGNNAAKIFTLTINGQSTNTTTKSGTLSGATGLAGKALYLKATGAGKNDIKLYNATAVVINTSTASHSIYCTTSGGGSLTANRNSATPGQTVTLTPTAAAGYSFTGYTVLSGGVSISGNTFTMGSSNVQIRANFSLTSYAITKAVNPAGAGTVSTKVSGSEVSAATMGTSVTVTQEAASGYYFDGWTTSPADLISSGAFTMPAGAVTVTANYKKRSTATMGSTVTGGGTALLTIAAEDPAYSHKWKLDFGTGMASDWTDVDAGVVNVTMNIPDSWSEQIPNDTSKSDGTLTLKTYDEDDNEIGSYQITGLTYAVRESAVPSIGTISKAIALETGLGVYVQNHSGVTIGATGTGVLGSTIAAMQVQVSGYAGNQYNTLVQNPTGGAVSFTTGILTIAGKTTITVTATDSRGRTKSKTATITVSGYSAPYGTLAVERVDSGGTPDDMGQYGTFTITSGITNIGSNQLMVKTITSQGTTVTPGADSGDLLPGTGNRQTFSEQSEYTITLTLQDKLETTVITAKYIMHVDGGGDRLAFFKAVSKTIPTGKDSVIEFSANTQIYIGNDTLEDYITAIINSLS